MNLRKIFLITTISLLYISTSWASEELTGKWKTIDDRSGFPQAIINISKNTNASYDGKIEKIYTLPNGTEPVDKCIHCKGDLKDKPMIGLNILSNFILNEKNKNEYINGQVIDPITGNIYKGKIRMSPNGKKITLRGYIGTSLLGRSQIWIRID